MPDFKIVINDPEAGKNRKSIRVKIIGDPEIPYTDKMKEQLELPMVKVNANTAQKIDAKHGVVTIRMRRPDTRDKVKLTGKTVIDNNVPDDVIKVNSEKLIDLTGVTEIEGEVFRASAWQIRINDERTQTLIGLKLGDEIEGSILGLKNVKLVITGGSDLSGFPMRHDILGPIKKRVLLSGPPGFHPREEGERRRKMVRGNTISPDIVQINTMIKYQ